MILNHMEQMIAISRTADPVRLPWIRHKPKLLRGINQRLNHLNAVLKVDIVVACAVNQQQRSMQFSSRLGYGRFVITFAVVLRQSEIALCVRRIVIVPIADGRDGNSSFEHLGVRHRVQSHEAAIAPSPDRNVVVIKLGKLRQQLIQCRELVV